MRHAFDKWGRPIIFDFEGDRGNLSPVKASPVLLKKYELTLRLTLFMVQVFLHSIWIVFIKKVSNKEINSHRKFYKASVIQKALFECSCSTLVGKKPRKITVKVSILVQLQASYHFLQKNEPVHKWFFNIADSKCRTTIL